MVSARTVCTICHPLHGQLYLDVFKCSLVYQISGCNYTSRYIATYVQALKDTNTTGFIFWGGSLAEGEQVSATFPVLRVYSPLCRFSGVDIQDMGYLGSKPQGRCWTCRPFGGGGGPPRPPYKGRPHCR